MAEGSSLRELNALGLGELWRELAGSRGLARRLFELARDEDLGEGGDVTTAAMFGDGAKGASVCARVRAREEMVVAGLAGVGELAEVFAGGAAVRPTIADGRRVDAGAVLAEVEGPASAVLALERTVLNLIGRLSGVATRTALFVAEASRGGPAAVLDTRKTTPGLRVLEKYAVRCGGGTLHRVGLHDAVLIKDNHLAGLDASGVARRVGGATAWARADRPLRFVECEVDRPEQLDAVLGLGPPPGGVDVVLLDNMSPGELGEAVRRRDAAGLGAAGGRRPAVALEASGGVTLETIRAIAATGVDRISVGSLTHGAVSRDLGMDRDERVERRE